MADIQARTRHIIGTPADWAAHDLVLGNGEFALERNPNRVAAKIGDGAKKWSETPYFRPGYGIDVRDFNVKANSQNDQQADIERAIQAAQDEGIWCIDVEEQYTVFGTLSPPPGMTVRSKSGATHFFEAGNPQDAVKPGFIKPDAGGVNGPVMVLSAGMGIIGLTLEHQKLGGAKIATGGLLQWGRTGAIAENNINVERCTLIGHEIDWTTRKRRAGVECALLVSPVSAVGTQRYKAYINNLRMKNAYIGMMLGGQFNASQCYGLNFDEVYRSFWLEGGGGDNEVLGNTFHAVNGQNYPLPTVALTDQQVAALPIADRIREQQDLRFITSRDRVNENRLIGFYEGGGGAFDVTGEGLRQINYVDSLFINSFFPTEHPIGWSYHRLFSNRNFAPPVSEIVRSAQQQVTILEYEDDFKAVPTWGPNQRVNQGVGSDLEFSRTYTDATLLPTMNGGDAILANDPSTRRFALWRNPSISSDSFIAIKGELCIIINAGGGGNGMTVFQCDFLTGYSDSASPASSYWVHSANQFHKDPNNIIKSVWLSHPVGEPMCLGLTLGSQVVKPLSIHAAVKMKLYKGNNGIANFGDYFDVDWTMAAITPAQAAAAQKLTKPMSLSPLATDLATVIALANDLRGLMNTHSYLKL
jgi:hypothetical protein